VTKCSAENLGVSVDVNNRLQGGYGYDAAGNMTRDNSGTAYVYDAENRISSTLGFTYLYDADGNRVQKTNGNTTPATGTLYWSMSPGIVAESDLAGNPQAEYIFFDGERVARKDFPGNTVSYYLSDHLKTASVITDATGTIKSESDYYPWGGELQFTNGDSNHYKFTGKERDAESGLDYFGARHYSNQLGRFITPDWSNSPDPVPYSDLDDPQSLNRFSYVRNIPTSNIDEDGHLPCGGGPAHITVEVTPHGSSMSQDPDCDQHSQFELGTPGSERSTAANIAIGVGKEILNSAKPVVGVGSLITAVQNGNFSMIEASIHLLLTPDLRAANRTQDKAMKVTFWASLFIPFGGEEAAASKLERTAIHHIATNKNIAGGFTKLFEKIFARAGMTLEDEANKMPVSTLFHNGPHPVAYHEMVLQRLSSAVGSKQGDAAASALLRALNNLRRFIEQNPGVLRK
jgi:RHS repeat-associated protein